MPWVVGIDEAGYGPNLGPLVQAGIALHLPEDDRSGWEALEPVPPRAGDFIGKLAQREVLAPHLFLQQLRAAHATRFGHGQRGSRHIGRDA